MSTLLLASSVISGNNCRGNFKEVALLFVNPINISAEATPALVKAVDACPEAPLLCGSLPKAEVELERFHVARPVPAVPRIRQPRHTKFSGIVTDSGGGFSPKKL